jgi:putative phosphoesterase
LAQVKTQGAERILCLGDLINPGIARDLSQSEIPVLCVWGNNDGDVYEILQFARSDGSVLEMSKEKYAQLEIDGKRIFISHYPEIAEPLAYSGHYDVVFHGHTHRQYQKMVDNCLLLCPGELSTHVTGLATFAIYDTQSHQAEIIEVEGAVNWKW